MRKYARLKLNYKIQKSAINITSDMLLYRIVIYCFFMLITSLLLDFFNSITYFQANINQKCNFFHQPLVYYYRGNASLSSKLSKNLIMIYARFYSLFRSVSLNITALRYILYT